MDKEQAQRIVRDTLENPFDKGRFTLFVKNLLNSIEDAPFSYKGNFIPDAYEQYISTFERIGKYTDGEHKFDILVVKLKKETSIDRARTMQRNFIAWYLNGSRGGDMKDAALVAFVSPDQEDWRFSLVKMDYRFEERENGKTKIKEEFTPARRWSFLVGKNEKSHTAQSKLVPIMADDEHKPSLTMLEEAFNIETVTKEFFEKYRELFLKTKEGLDAILIDNKVVKADFAAKNVNTVDFAKKLLGQIVFLYFLQKKGWFGVARDAAWGTGPKNFLRELFDGRHGSYRNFFNDILESLFYEALARERDDDFYSRFNCKIPFLNGGLFDPIGGYDWIHTDILLPEELFSNSLQTKEGDKGNGILDIFDRYNFTVKEDEPLEKEVAVDPEMLGKVFENLLEVRDRKSKGTYYTPREIVHYMCRQSLINYLHTELNGGTIAYEMVGKEQLDIFGNKAKSGQLDLTIEHGSSPAIPKADIETLIQCGEQLGENEAAVEAKGRETPRYSYKLAESIRQYAQLIDEKLAAIRVCDPAIGSGAFPVGMMSEIVKIRNVLSVFIKDPGRSIYHFKRECIEKSLYGVDIDPGAVEIAKLRLWLSLVVDEDDIREIKPLPNLDYKIVCGNSLGSVMRDVLNDHLFGELESLKTRYFDETSPGRKKNEKIRIDELISKLTHNNGCFDYHIYFNEVFDHRGGFDIVIGNPPYVRADSGDEHLAMRRQILKSKQFETLWEKWDLFIPFMERSYKLLKSGGITSLIVSDAYCHSKYAQKSQKWFLKNSRILRLDFFSKIKVFEAGVHNLTYFFQKADGNRWKPERRVHEPEFGSFNLLQTDEQGKLDYRVFFPEERKGVKISGLFKTLHQICYVSYGLRPSSDENDAKGEFVTADLVAQTRDDIHCKPYVEGKHLARWLPSCNLWIEWDTDRAPSKFCRPTFSEMYDVPEKIIAQRSPGPDPIVCYDASQLIFTPASVGFIPWNSLTGVRNRSIRKSGRYLGETSAHTDLPKREELEEISHQFSVKYLLAVMNSKVARDFLRANRRSNIHLYPDDWKKLPIPCATQSKQAPIIALVNQILVNPSSPDVSSLESEINSLVYELYELSQVEISIIEGRP
jgi:type I restriction-modification system DNA methylase subunit